MIVLYLKKKILQARQNMSESNIKDCVGVGIISTAFIARKTIKAIRKAVGVRVVAVASRSLEKAKNFAEQEGYFKYVEMLYSAHKVVY